MSSARRLLFLAYWVPPRKGIGTIRSKHVLEHLNEFGWDVDVITARFQEEYAAVNPRWTQTSYHDVKGALKRLAGIGNKSASEAFNLSGSHYGGKPNLAARLVRLVAAFATYPDDYVGWLAPAVGKVRRLLAGGRYDALLTSSPPVTTNLIAALSHGNVPWIADQRDLWAENDSTERSVLQVLFDAPLERLSLSHAAALTASSELSAQRFRNRYPRKPCYGISTGFEAGEWDAIPFESEPACTLLHAGAFYRGKRDPSLLFSALREIFEQRLAAPGDFRVDLYSDPEPWLLELIAAFGLDAVVRVHGVLDRRAVLVRERRADRLLVFSWDGPTAEGIMPGKIFEYFGARRPILAIGGTKTSAMQQLLSQTGAGARCLTTEEVKHELMEALREHGYGPRQIGERAVQPYSGQRCAQAFAQVLDSVVDGTSGVGVRGGAFGRTRVRA